MAETSYPVVEQPLTLEQWKTVTLGIGDGILDEGGQPYRLDGLDNAANTAKVRVDSRRGYAHAILRGHYHRIDTDATVALPAVTATTTYYIALQYDPARTAMPVKLVVVTALDTSLEKAHLVLHTVTRRANELLTAATVTSVSPKIASSIQVDRIANLPDPGSVLWGTTAWCWRDNVSLRASWTQWVPVSGATVALPQIADWEWHTSTYGLDVSPVKGGWSVRLAGSLLRTGPEYTYPDGWTALGVAIPAGYRPRETASCVGMLGGQVIGVTVEPDGTMKVRGLGATVKVPKSWGITFDLAWVTSTDVVA